MPARTSSTINQFAATAHLSIFIYQNQSRKVNAFKILFVFNFSFMKYVLCLAIYFDTNPNATTTKSIIQTL